MNKGDLISKMAADSGISKVQASAALNAFTDAITDSLAKGENVQLTGFGTFKVNERAARKGRNPQTGQEIPIKASRVASFKPGSGLSNSVKLK